MRIALDLMRGIILMLDLTQSSRTCQHTVVHVFKILLCWQLVVLQKPWNCKPA
jgi:hypothetical protein